jgi:hypothetical protein
LDCRIQIKEVGVKIRILFIAIPCFVLFFSCGRYYTCDIAGYVKDSQSNTGVNGALVRMYLSEPDSADDSGFIVETATMTSGGNPGYYSHKIIWEDSPGSFGEEGDSGVIWIGVSHEDYTSTVVKVEGIISDTLNIVPDIKIDRASFETPTVTGRVVNVNGEGVNGVRVVLDLQSTGGTDADYVTTTATLEGETGHYRFNNVSWRDDTPDSQDADTENAGIYIDDPDYTSDNDDADPLPVILTSDQDTDITENIVVTRQPRTEFSTYIRGRCYYRLGSGADTVIILIPGVEVIVKYTDDMGEHTLYDITDENGVYRLLIEWTHNTPAGGTGGVPEGEDTISLSDVDFLPNSTEGNYYSFDEQDGYTVKSWINPNYLPDSVDTNPDA